MLLRINIKNFLSFYKESSFDMFPNLKRSTFTNHIYDKNEIPLLKQAVIYGANGSGKSNLLKAIRFIKAFATKKDFINKELLTRNKFRLLEDDNTEPICISVEFRNRNDYYLYKIELKETKIKEELFISGIGKKEDELIFRRDGKEIQSNEVNSPEIKNAINKLIKNNPYSSLLSLNSEFPILNNAHLKIAHNWFRSKLKILSLNRIIPALIDLMSHKESLLDFANEIFIKIGLGIESLEIKSDNLNEILNSEDDKSRMLKDMLKKQLESSSGISRMQYDKVLFTIVKEKEEQLVKRFVFKQLGINGYTGEMDIEDQSDGTVKLLNLIPALSDIIEKDDVICIDEIENSIHPSLIKALILFFSNSKSKGQLIFTTHETELLNQQTLMRPDEVWFTEKNKGETKLYSLNEFKEHNTINIRNGYLEGRYGAIPFIGNLGE